MKYQVFQDGKPCSSYNIKGWDKDIFDTLEEASIFAWCWALPISMEDAKDYHAAQPFELNKPRATWGDAVVMEIKGVL